MNVEEKVKKILEVLLEYKIESEDVISEAEDLWDSLKHLEIIVTLEEEFGIKFAQEDIPKLNSMSAIVSKIKELIK